MPHIPSAELDSWSVGELISRIEEDGRYRVHVYDGSLGKGYPVAATAIIDRFRGTFGINFGSHPSLAVAVERTLTEAFQGKDIGAFESRTHCQARPSHYAHAGRRAGRLAGMRHRAHELG